MANIFVFGSNLAGRHGKGAALFALTPWDVCDRMETDAAKVQCMEAHFE